MRVLLVVVIVLPHAMVDALVIAGELATMNVQVAVLFGDVSDSNIYRCHYK